MLRYKKYKDYEEYKAAQIAKPNLPGRKDYIRQKSERKYADNLRLFAKFNDFFKGMRRVLCLGARFGEEVRAFRELGHYAIGIDLLDDETDLVVRGDWNDMPFEDKSFDVIYTNSIDHCYDISMMIKEINRVMAPDGILILDLSVQHCHEAADKVIEAKFANPERYEAMLWNKDEDVTSPFLGAGYTIKMVWYGDIFNTYLLERNNGKAV